MHKGVLLVFSLFVAFFMSLWMPQAGNYLYNPPWMLLVVCYWLIALPVYVGFWLPFFVGLMMDVALGAPLGAHALAMTIPAWVLLSFFKRALYHSVVRQMGMIGLLALLYDVVLACVYGFMGMMPSSLIYFLSPVLAACVWIPVAFYARKSSVV